MDGSAKPHSRVFLFRREQSESLADLFAALAKTKLDPEWRSAVTKNAKAQYGGFVNLAGLVEATEKPLARNSLIVDQTFHYDSDGEPILLVTELGHGGSGQFMRSILPIPRIAKVQDQKSAITYMRRAGYEAMLGLAPADARSDDDGDAANGAMGPAGDGGAWRRNEMLARQKIGKAESAKELDELLKRVNDRVADGTLNPDSLASLEEAVFARRKEVAPPKAKA
jgi:hypothetical protein